LTSKIVWRGIAIVILLVVLWAAVRSILGLASALVHLLLFIADLVLVYVLGRRVVAEGPSAQPLD
jgi:hypothetical protein